VEQSSCCSTDTGAGYKTADLVTYC